MNRRHFLAAAPAVALLPAALSDPHIAKIQEVIDGERSLADRWSPAHAWELMHIGISGLPARYDGIVVDGVHVEVFKETGSPRLNYSSWTVRSKTYTRELRGCLVLHPNG